MRLFRRIVVGAVAAVALVGTVSLGQEVEPPFTWKGKGVASLIDQSGIKETSFTFELSVDASGGIKGKTSNDEGQSAIKQMFYGQTVKHELPGYFSRKVVLVLMINEESAEPIVAVLNGRLLADRFFSGEVLIKRSESGSETDKALGIGSPMATPIEEDNLPSSLKSALKKTMPFGTVKIEGAYQK